ncbi:hypothetical protein V5O48_005375 [Marasmius crinis-equi]|uniref:Uncharacterized protein n=1 Tax=Marasmius crinis-equi TaxID=585013 RepID=A0ABR3FN84_9AGAR
MDIKLSPTLVAKHPDVFPLLEGVIRREQAEVCLRVTTDTNCDMFTSKITRFDLGGRIEQERLTECGLNVPEDVGIVWFDVDEMIKDGEAVSEGLLQSRYQTGVSRWVVFVVGATNRECGEIVDNVGIRLSMRFRMQFLCLQSISDAVEELYRWSISLNPFLVLYPGHELDVHYIARVMMLLLKGEKNVPLARRVAQIWYDEWSTESRDE